MQAAIKVIEQKETALKQLYKLGLLPHTILRDAAIYQLFDADFRATQNKMQSYCNVAEMFGVSEKTVQRAVKKMV